MSQALTQENTFYRCPNTICSWLKTQNLDIRLRGKEPASRFIDQKVTPDVLSVVSMVIVNFSIDRQNQFTSSDIWNSEDFEAAISQYFSKPSSNEKTARREYDKFIGQCLNTLNFSGIITLIGKNGVKNVFRVIKPDILNYISSHDRNAFIFIVAYLKEVLNQSELATLFDQFLFDKNDTDAYYSLKDTFDQYLKKHTNISEHNYYESKRIFTKVLNPLAHYYKKNGTKRGRLSKHLITYDELLYNRLNWRDVHKEKGITRQQFEQQHNFDPSRTYLVQKSKSKIKSFHMQLEKRLVSEVRDGLDENVTASHVHHIFPESRYPDLSDQLENLILLTPSQHLDKAHPKGNTNLIDPVYQKLCLLSKLETILNPRYELFYSISSFMNMLRLALDIIIPNDFDELTKEEIYSCVERTLTNYYKS